MENVIVSYFTKLFDSAGPVVVDNILKWVQPKVTATMNQELLLPFTNEEIKFAFFQMHPTKAPGPNGMSPKSTRNIRRWSDMMFAM